MILGKHPPYSPIVKFTFNGVQKAASREQRLANAARKVSFLKQREGHSLWEYLLMELEHRRAIMIIDLGESEPNVSFQKLPEKNRRFYSTIACLELDLPLAG